MVPLVLDLVVVTAFVLIGRRTHDEGLVSLGTLHAWWPFLVALLVGWLTARQLRRPLDRPAAGALVWLITLLLGMGLRSLTGQGTALPFVVVATLTLGAGLLGWRVIVRWVAARRVRAGAPGGSGPPLG